MSMCSHCFFTRSAGVYYAQEYLGRGHGPFMISQVSRVFYKVKGFPSFFPGYCIIFRISLIFTIRNSSCEKVMFLPACVKYSVHGGGGGRRTPPLANTPLGGNPCPNRHPPLQADIHTGSHPPPRRQSLQQTVRILLECILV